MTFEKLHWMLRSLEAMGCDPQVAEEGIYTSYCPVCRVGPGKDEEGEQLYRLLYGFDPTLPQGESVH